MRLARLLLPVLMLAATSPAAADEPGLDWRPVSADASKVRIVLPAARDQALYFRAQTANYSANLFIARVPTAAHQADQLSLVYVELLPGYYFPERYDVDEVLTLKTLQRLHLRKAERFTLVAGAGAYDIATFTIDGDVACAAFARTWGSFAGDQVGSGSRRLSGYGCEDRGKPLGRERIREALAALEIDD